MTRQKEPPGLDAAGSELWAAMTEGITYRPDELAVLRGACRLADFAAELEEALEDEPLTVEGSRGQKTVNPLVVERRLTIAEVSRQLARLDVPEFDEDGDARNSRRTSHRQSARARWHARAEAS